jgi:hypothetical protein
MPVVELDSQGSRAAAEQVGFFVVRDGRIVKQNVNLEHLARSHGVLREYEVIA